MRPQISLRWPIGLVLILGYGVDLQEARAYATINIYEHLGMSTVFAPVATADIKELAPSPQSQSAAPAPAPAPAQQALPSPLPGSKNPLAPSLPPPANYQTSWLRLQYPPMVQDGRLAVLSLELLEDCRQLQLKWLEQQPMLLPLVGKGPKSTSSPSADPPACQRSLPSSPPHLMAAQNEPEMCVSQPPSMMDQIYAPQASTPIPPATPRHYHVWLATPLGQQPNAYPLLITCDDQQLQIPLQVVEGRYPVSILQVDPKFTKPPPPRTVVEQQKIQEAFAKGVRQPLWHQAFLRPSSGATSSVFGVRRVYNRKTTGRHRGLDIAGPIGEPIYASNDGVVILAADDFFFIGHAVLIDHGAQLFSMYFHLNGKHVKAGDKVQRGQQIGTLGKTGRVTGPHLHVAFKLGATYIDPLDVFAYQPGEISSASGSMILGDSHPLHEEEGLQP